MTVKMKPQRNSNNVIIFRSWWHPSEWLRTNFCQIVEKLEKVRERSKSFGTSFIIDFFQGKERFRARLQWSTPFKHAHTYTHARKLSLSLSHTHTHTRTRKHTQALILTCALAQKLQGFFLCIFLCGLLGLTSLNFLSSVFTLSFSFSFLFLSLFTLSFRFHSFFLSLFLYLYLYLFPLS